MRHAAGEHDLSGEAKRSDARLQPGTERTVTHEHEREIRAVARGDAHRVDGKRDVLDGHEAADDKRNAPALEAERGAHVRTIGPKRLDIDTFRHVLDGPAERGWEVLGGIAVSDDGVGEPQV